MRVREGGAGGGGVDEMGAGGTSIARDDHRHTCVLKEENDPFS